MTTVNIGKGMRLLYLMTIFFLYRIIIGLMEGDINESLIWTIFLIVYVISLTILYFVFKRWEKESSGSVG